MKLWMAVAAGLLALAAAGDGRAAEGAAWYYGYYYSSRLVDGDRAYDSRTNPYTDHQAFHSEVFQPDSDADADFAGTAFCRAQAAAAAAMGRPYYGCQSGYYLRSYPTRAEAEAALRQTLEEQRRVGYQINLVTFDPRGSNRVTIVAPGSPAAPPGPQPAEGLSMAEDLNQKILRQDAAVVARNQQAEAAYQESLAQHRAAQDAYEAKARAAAEAKAEYERERAAWEARVAACQAGDRTQCGP